MRRKGPSSSPMSRPRGGAASADPGSPHPGTSLLFSVNLRPPVETQRLPALTIVAGAAAAEGVRHATGLMPEIKLPNDLLVHGRKLAGILAEAREDRVVLGMGINVNVAAEQLPTGRRPRADLAARGARRAASTAHASSLRSCSSSSGSTTSWISAGGAAARR